MKPVISIVLTAVALACAACANLDGSASVEGQAGYASAAAPAPAVQSAQPVSRALTEWQHYPYPVNDDDGNPMPPVVVGDP